MHGCRLNALWALIALALVGCGGDSEPKGPSPDRIASRFEEAAGVRPRPGQSSADWTVLALPTATDRFEQFGIFTLYVTKTERGRDTLLSEPGSDRPSKAENGLYFRTRGGANSVAKRYGKNVILVSQLDEPRKVDDKFRRLDATVRAAVTGDLDAIPAAERPCRSQGIDPDAGSGREGLCRLDAVQVTVANSGSELKTPVLAARLRAARVASSIPPPTAYGTAEKARGRFVIVSFELHNTSDAPIEFLDSQLLVAGLATAPTPPRATTSKAAATGRCPPSRTSAWRSGRPLTSRPTSRTARCRKGFSRCPPNARRKALRSQTAAHRAG